MERVPSQRKKAEGGRKNLFGPRVSEGNKAHKSESAEHRSFTERVNWRELGNDNKVEEKRCHCECKE